jgi:hypothetical protein
MCSSGSIAVRFFSLGNNAPAGRKYGELYCAGKVFLERFFLVHLLGVKARQLKGTDARRTEKFAPGGARGN